MNFSRFFDGKMEIYCEESAKKVFWSSYETDIQEVMEELNKRK